MSRGILGAVGVALLLVTAGCAGSFAPATEASAQTQQDRGKTIRVSATGQAQATPDQAIVRVAVLAEADDANVVRERLAENASRMREALRKLGIPEDQIRTVSFNIDQTPPDEERREMAAEFRGFHAFEIIVSNVSRAGTIIDAAVSNGADRVESVELTLSEERRREVRAAALRDAMENARANAGVIAESANLTLAGVHSAATADFNFSPIRAQAVQEEAAGQPTTQIESGPVTVVAEVQVTYNATG